MPLHSELKKASTYAAKWAGVKILNNALTLTAATLALFGDEENSKLVAAQAAMTYLSIAGDAVIAYVESVELLKTRTSKLDKPAFRIYDEKLRNPHNSNPYYSEFVIPTLGTLLGVAAESLGLAVSHDSTKKILKFIAAPLSAVFYTAHSTAIDHETTRLDTIPNGSIRPTPMPVDEPYQPPVVHAKAGGDAQRPLLEAGMPPGGAEPAAAAAAQSHEPIPLKRSRA